MFDGFVSDTKKYLQLFIIVDLYLQIVYRICMYKPDLALNNLQLLIGNKPNQTNQNFEREGFDTTSIFKWSLTSFNSHFSFL